MKNLIIILLLTFSICSFAQSENKSELDSINVLVSKLKEKGINHLKFKDIPIDGNINSFVNELKKQDYKILDVSQESAILTGKFTGEEVYIFVQATQKSIVYGVTVVFNEKETWKSIKSQYENYKISLAKKYGEPIESIEKFDNDNIESIGMELYALKEERYNYFSFFGVNKDGVIKLSISPDAKLVINYADTINFLIANIESQNDL